MEESFAAAMRTNLLDPAAQEFYPSSQFALHNPQNYNPYPAPPPSPFPSHYVHPPQSAADDNPSSRAVVLSMVPPHVTEPSITHSMMAFGGVRAIDTNFLSSEGIVTVHFYDLRSAQVAVAEVREQHVRQQSRLGQQFYGFFPAAPPQIGGRGLIEGQAVWAQFGAKGLDVLNQGSLFVTASGASAISSDGVREIFEAFGPVKEVRESPTRIQNKFVEFFDVRDAARALNELNGRDVNGVRLAVDFSRPTGAQSRSYNQQNQHQNRRSSHQSFSLPPRLARSNSQASSSDGSSRDKQCARISNVTKNSNSNSNKQGKKSKGNNSNNYPSSSSSSPSTTPSSKQGGGGGGGSNRKSWKNHGSKSNSGGNAKSISSDSCRFEIKEAAVAVVEGSASSSSFGSSSSSCMRDARTTVMIKNIPNKYSQKLLLNMLDNHCIHCNEQIGEGGGDEPLSAYDFVYLPIDFNNKCNVGYGFVNLTSPEAAVRLYKAFHMQPWEVFNSRKICQVTYARLQGLEVLKEHFRNSKFACDNDEYLPVVFEPARDGKQVTEPLPIGGRSSGDLLTKMPSEGGDDGDDDDSKGADEEEALSASSSLQMQRLQVSSSSPSSYI